MTSLSSSQSGATLSPSTTSPEATASLGSTLAAITDLVRAASWPLIVLVLLIVFWTPAHSAMNQLPEVLGRTSTVTIAGLTLEIDSRLEALGVEPSAATKTALQNVSASDVSLLMGFSNVAKRTYRDGAEAVRLQYRGLVTAGLLTEVPEQELAGASYGLELTQEGRDAIAFLNGVVAAVVAQLPKAGS